MGYTVAPLVGAWIEMPHKGFWEQTGLVAPLEGAWIEITVFAVDALWNTSLLSWERGLKYLPYSRPQGRAWSLLSWERGLKFASLDRFGNSTVSLLSWERGLKSDSFLSRQCVRAVAPLVGAWIEIPCEILSSPCSFVAPLVGAWIEIHTR